MAARIRAGGNGGIRRSGSENSNCVFVHATAAIDGFWLRLSTDPMKLDRYLDYFLTIVTLGCALPGWIQLILRSGKRKMLLAPVGLLTASVLVAAFFEYLITFGRFTMDDSWRFAAAGCPLGILAIVFARTRQIGRAAPWIWFGSGAILLLWWVLVLMQ
ncbi:MAG TPA: hypothetical protein VME68_13750 [Acidobacteriaceae bacterium]|nr:hypothetical protein [Acidobacteriaceae bacterium]